MASDAMDTQPGRDIRVEQGRTVIGAPRLTVSLECRRLMAPSVQRLALDRLDEVILARNGSGLIEHAPNRATIYVSDFQTSRQHLALRRTPTGWQVVDLGSRNGTMVNGDLIQSLELSDGDLIEAGGTMLMFLEDDEPLDESVERERLVATPMSARAAGLAAFQTLNIALERRIRQLAKIAPSIVPVLVRGETGSGKELIARAIHELSGRPGPFVAVNCGALPRDLIESELFGHRRGAFSGAGEDREGLVRRAHNGTLFLDEIAELPPDSQVALLRVLQEGEVRPVGATEAVKVDVRIVAATHQDLQRRIAAGAFRQDLYGRIAGFEARMPALRDRIEDLGILIAAMLPRVCAHPEQVTLNRAAARALFRYRWPLNIRELEQALRAAVALSDGHEIRLEHLPESIRLFHPIGAPVTSAGDRVLREQLIELLRNAGGNVASVARSMNRAPVQIRRWCRRLQIDLAQFRP
jgi:DNA-binding NtrC family response regulator